MIEVPVNYLAVVVAAVANMAVGFAWFGPLFGKMWISMMGWTAQHMEEAKKKSMAKTYAIAFVGSLLTAYVLSHLIVFAASYMQTNGVSVGLSTAFWIWLGFVVPLLLSMVLWEGKPWKLYFLNVSYYIVSLLVMGAIIAAWK